MAQEIEVHPAANLFPMLGKAELEALADDIRKHGQHDAIVYYQNKLLDGRNRLAACELLGIEPQEAEIDDDDPRFDPVQYVLTVNLHRRHLNEAQRAIVAAKVKKQLEPAAMEREKAGKSKDGNGGGRGRKKNLSLNLDKGFSPQATDSASQVAKMLNVSRASVAHATTVLNEGSPELIEKLERGEIAVSRAAKIAKSVPKEQQVEAAEAKQEKQSKPKVVLDDLKRLWPKASAAEQAAFLQWAG